MAAVSVSDVDQSRNQRSDAAWYRGRTV